MSRIKSMFLAVILLVLTAGAAREAKAQVIVTNDTIISGAYVRWGYYPIIRGHWHRNYFPRLYGYSYYPFWNYLPAYQSFGAIAYSPSANRAGISYGQLTQPAAIHAARSFCGVDDCTPMVWVQGGCAAVAKSPSSTFVGWGHHAYRAVAEQYALNACIASGAQGCQIGAWTCSN